MKTSNNIFKRLFFISGFIFISLMNLSAQNQIKVLVILPEYYGANYYLNMDNFERFGWNITTAGLTKNVRPCTSYAGPLGCPIVTVDLLISEITDVTSYDCITIMSATAWSATPPCNGLINDQSTLNLIKTATDSGLVVAATCSGVRVLAAAGVIEGKEVTGSPKYNYEYIAANATFVGRNHYPVIDGNIVTTAAGDFFNLQNCDAIARAIDRRLQGTSNGLNSVMKLIEIQDNRTLSKSSDDDIVSKTIGGSNAEGGRAICQTNDGGFVIAGYTFSQGNGYADVLVVKTDADGNQLWSKTFGGSVNDYANSVAENADGSLILAGFTSSFGSGDEDVYIIKLDSDGNKIWSKNYGGSGSEIANKIIETSNGNYFIAGHTDSYGKGQDDVYLVYTDADGDSLWTRTKGDINSQFAEDIIETTEGII